MARLYEHQAKNLLRNRGIETPDGRLAFDAETAYKIAEELTGEVVVKAQVYTTSRAQKGGIKFAATPEEARSLASAMIGSKIDAEICNSVLVEKKLRIKREFYLGFIIDSALKRPVLVFSEAGGTGIEERASTTRRLVCSVRYPPTINQIRTICPDDEIALILRKLYEVAISFEARSAEINPLARLEDGRLVAIDCRISVDDYAVFRHKDLGIEIAREINHTPTKLEKIAWKIEENDYRGTFYFIEIPDENTEGIKIGFHGAGGGGAMASFDAAERNGLSPACYVDTSGNPPASKVYRATRIILSIPKIRGYFLSGSGVASQEQFVLARGVLKAFLEIQPRIPAVLRLGGNGEEIAKELVERFARFLPAPMQAYQKFDSADFCAAKLRELIQNPAMDNPHALTSFNDFGEKYEFKTRTGKIIFNHSIFQEVDASIVIDACPVNILKENSKGLPVLAIEPEEAERGKCIECLACEFASLEAGIAAVKIELPIEGLDDVNSDR